MQLTVDPNNRDILIPTKQVLDEYYRMWLEGADQDAMLQYFSKHRMGVRACDLEKYASCFTNYCRYKVQFETEENLVKYGHALQIPLTEERRKLFLEMAKSGVAINKIARVMNIPVMTIFDYWYIIDPSLRMEVEAACDLLDVKVTMALSKRAIGYKVKNKTVSTTEGTGADGRAVDLRVESVTERDVPADINAIKLWLINRTPDRFSADGSVNRDDNRGKIMDFIDNEVGRKIESGDMVQIQIGDAEEVSSADKEDSDV